MEDGKVVKSKFKPFLSLPNDKDSPTLQIHPCFSASTTNSTDSPPLALSLLYTSLSSEEEVHTLTLVKELREVSALLDQELTPFSVREERQGKATVQLQSPMCSPFLRRRCKLGFSEMAASFVGSSQ